MIGTDIEKAKAVLENGGLVGIPTETVYGLAANALNVASVVKIFEAKNRPAFDPLIVHIGDQSQLDGLVTDVPATAQKLMDAFWPGPLTFILDKTPNVPDLVTSGHPTVGVRMPKHPMTLELLRSLNFPLAAPSANPFGYVSPTIAEHVENQLGERIDYVLEGGQAQVGVESTIIKFEGDDVIVLRLGGVSIDALERVLGKPVQRIQTSSSQPDAPGMLSSHYNPGKRVYLFDEIPMERPTGFDKKNIGVLSMRLAQRPDYAASWFPISKTGNPEEAARNLFIGLRSMDNSEIDVVFAEMAPKTGLGLAINDRLTRSASQG